MTPRLLTIAVVVFGLQFIHIPGVAAQTAGSSSDISIRPFLQQLTLNPTEASKQFSLTIANNSKVQQSFNLSAVNFGSLNETGGLVFEGSNSIRLNSYGLANWIVLDKDSIDLAPGQQTNVQVSITNGTDLSPGAHYAAVIVSGAAGESANAQVALKPQLSSLIFLTKLGGEHYNIHLVSATNNSTLWSPPTQIDLRLSSTGNTFIIPRGIVSLKRNGKTISKGVVNDQSSIVLPQTTRSFEVPLNPISHASSGLFFSKYQIVVDYRYDGVERYATKTYSITVINKLTISIIIAGLLAALFYKRLIHDNPKIRKKIKSNYKSTVSNK